MADQPNGQSFHMSPHIPPLRPVARQTDGVKQRNVRACRHIPACPSADQADREAAHTIVAHPEQGWSLLCNGIVLFDDTGELLPNGQVIAPHRPTDVHPEVFGIFAVA